MYIYIYTPWQGDRQVQCALPHRKCTWATEYHSHAAPFANPHLQRESKRVKKQESDRERERQSTII